MTDWNLLRDSLGTPETVSKEYEVFASEPAALARVNLAGASQQLHTGPIIMRTQALENYYMLSEGYVDVEFRIFNVNGNVIVPTDVMTLISGGWNLFDRATLKIGAETVEVCNLPGLVHNTVAAAKYTTGEFDDCHAQEWIYWPKMKYRTGLAATVAFDPDLTDTYTSLGMAQPVDTTQLISCGPDAANDGQDGAAGAPYIPPIREQELHFNPAYAKMFARTRQSLPVRLQLPLRAVLGFCERATPIHGLSVQLELTKNNDFAHILHGNAQAPACQTIITSCQLWLPRVKPSKAVLLDIETQFMNASAVWQYEAKTCIASPIYSSSTTRLDWAVGPLLDKPLAVLVGIKGQLQYGSQFDHVRHYATDANAGAAVTIASQVDSVDKTLIPRVQNNCANGALYSHLDDVTRVSCRINNKPYPQEDYNVSFLEGEKSVVRPYYDFLKLFCKNRGESCPVDFNVWAESPVWCFSFDEMDVEATGDVYNLHIEALTRSSVVGADIPAAARHYEKGGAGDFRLYCIVITQKSVYVRGEGGYFKLQVA